MNINQKWQHKEEWKQEGSSFCVVVSRHEATGREDLGIHRWAVYGCIYPKHPHFQNFENKEMSAGWSAAAQVMPLHCGVSFHRPHRDNDGKITSHQVGADYNHLHDGAFTYMGTPEEAHQVFADADKLFAWLGRDAEFFNNIERS